MHILKAVKTQSLRDILPGSPPISKALLFLITLKVYFSSQPFHFLFLLCDFQEEINDS